MVWAASVMFADAQVQVCGVQVAVISLVLLAAKTGENVLPHAAEGPKQELVPELIVLLTQKVKTAILTIVPPPSPSPLTQQ